MTRHLYLLALIATGGCDRSPANRSPEKSTAEDVRRDAGRALNTDAEYSEQAKGEFQKGLEKRRTVFDAELVKLREKGRELKDESNVNWERKMTELESKPEAARAKLDEVGRSSAETWKDVQESAQSAWDELDNAFRNTAREF